jgi:hypothetical protein
MPKREDVMNALLALGATALVGGSVPFQTATRKIVLVPGAPTPQVATPPKQPAMILTEGHETTSWAGIGTPKKRVWFAEFWLWAKIPQGETIGVAGTGAGATVVNNLIEALEGVLVPDDPIQQRLTLGKLVYNCWIEGETIKVPGDLNPDGQCFCTVPIRILVP